MADNLTAGSTASTTQTHDPKSHDLHGHDMHNHDLIASDRVEGTRVYDPDGVHIGSIERFMVEKRSGKVSYAVLSFGGFWSMGHDHYPLPWSKLDYDAGLGGYRVDVTKQQLENAPRVERDEEADWSEQYGRRIYDYYGIMPYWF